MFTCNSLMSFLSFVPMKTWLFMEQSKNYSGFLSFLSFLQAFEFDSAFMVYSQHGHYAKLTISDLRTIENVDLRPCLVRLHYKCFKPNFILQTNLFSASPGAGQVLWVWLSASVPPSSTQKQPPYRKCDLPEWSQRRAHLVAVCQRWVFRTTHIKRPYCYLLLANRVWLMFRNKVL